MQNNIQQSPIMKQLSKYPNVIIQDQDVKQSMHSLMKWIQDSNKILEKIVLDQVSNYSLNQQQQESSEIESLYLSLLRAYQIASLSSNDPIDICAWLYQYVYTKEYFYLQKINSTINVLVSKALLYPFQNTVFLYSNQIKIDIWKLLYIYAAFIICQDNQSHNVIEEIPLQKFYNDKKRKQPSDYIVHWEYFFSGCAFLLKNDLLKKNEYFEWFQELNPNLVNSILDEKRCANLINQKEKFLLVCRYQQDYQDFSNRIQKKKTELQLVFQILEQKKQNFIISCRRIEEIYINPKLKIEAQNDLSEQQKVFFYSMQIQVALLSDQNSLNQIYTKFYEVTLKMKYDQLWVGLFLQRFIPNSVKKYKKYLNQQKLWEIYFESLKDDQKLIHCEEILTQNQSTSQMISNIITLAKYFKKQKQYQLSFAFFSYIRSTKNEFYLPYTLYQLVKLAIKLQQFTYLKDLLNDALKVFGKFQKQIYLQNKMIEEIFIHINLLSFLVFVFLNLKPELQYIYKQYQQIVNQQNAAILKQKSITILEFFELLIENQKQIKQLKYRELTYFISYFFSSKNMVLCSANIIKYTKANELRGEKGILQNVKNIFFRKSQSMIMIDYKSNECYEGKSRTKGLIFSLSLLILIKINQQVDPKAKDKLQILLNNYDLSLNQCLKELFKPSKIEMFELDEYQFQLLQSVLTKISMHPQILSEIIEKVENQNVPNFKEKIKKQEEEEEELNKFEQSKFTSIQSQNVKFLSSQIMNTINQNSSLIESQYLQILSESILKDRKDVKFINQELQRRIQNDNQTIIKLFESIEDLSQYFNIDSNQILQNLVYIKTIHYSQKIRIEKTNLWDTTYACKEISVEMDNLKDLKNALQEVYLSLRISLLDCPYLIQLKHFAFRPKDNSITFYLLFPFFQRGILKSDGFSFKEKIRITSQILEGIDSMHKDAILHLDLKLMNILIDNEDRPIIIDFGSSREISDINSEFISESFDQITPNYCSRELLNGQISQKSDVYGFGCILIELFTNSQLWSDFQDNYIGFKEFDLYKEHEQKINTIENMIIKDIIKQSVSKYEERCNLEYVKKQFKLLVCE